MSLSRDEAREVAAVAIGLTIAMRIGAGAVGVVDELTQSRNPRWLLGRFLSPVNSTMGLLTLSLALLLVLSPAGSIERRTFRWAKPVAAMVSLLGAAFVLHKIAFGFDSFANSMSSAAKDGFAALILGAAAWWILKNFDGNR